MKPFALLAAAALAFAPACGDDDDNGTDTVDAPPADVDGPADEADAMQPDAGPDLPNSGFVPPTEATVVLDDSGAEVAADWTCLGTPADEEPAAGPVEVSGVVQSALDGSGVAGATVTMHAGFDFETSVGEATTDEDGSFDITVDNPEATRYSFQVLEDTIVDTYYVNSPLASPTTNVTINAVNNAIIIVFEGATGETIMEGNTVVAASITDCQGRPVANTVAMVSTEAGAQTHVDGADTYYFSTGDMELPVNHEDQPDSNVNGLFAIVNVPAADSSFVQVWGFVDADDLADGEMTLLGELEMTTLADAFMSGGIQPLRTAGQ